MAVFRWGPLMGTSNAGAMKNRDFKPISLFILEMIQDRAIWNANRNSYAIYRMVLFQMTLSDLSALAKYSITRSIARPLCDSWTSCKFNRRQCCILQFFLCLHHISQFYRRLLPTYFTAMFIAGMFLQSSATSSEYLSSLLSSVSILVYIKTVTVLLLIKFLTD